MARHKDRFFAELALLTPANNAAASPRDAIALQRSAAMDEVWDRRIAPALRAAAAGLNEQFAPVGGRLALTVGAAAATGEREAAILAELPGRDVSLNLSLSDAGQAVLGSARTDYMRCDRAWLEAALKDAVGAVLAARH